MKKHEFKNYDGLGLAELVHKKQVKPIELLETAVSEMETLNPQINAVIHTMYEQARVAAQNVTTGRFAGVPILLKDIGQGIKGEPKTLGSRSLVNYRAKKDSEYVKRLRNGGFLFLGQTNVPEFGFTNKRGEWIIEGYGVDPDIEVDNDPQSVIAGKDPQLERAIAEVMGKLKQPVKLPPKPAPPVKTNNRQTSRTN